jgi:hypothetical protein
MFGVRGLWQQHLPGARAMLMSTASLYSSAPWMLRQELSESAPQPAASVPVGDTKTSTAAAATAARWVREGSEGNGWGVALGRRSRAMSGRRTWAA